MMRTIRGTWIVWFLPAIVLFVFSLAAPLPARAATTGSVNAGGSGSGSFVADAYYSGGSTYSTTSAIDTSQLAAPVPPQAALQTERYGNFTYTIPGFTAGTAATVTLYFVEAYWTSAGQRSFSVAINGATVLSAFDIYAAAGGRYRAIARTFNTTANASGQVVIQFANGSVDNAKVDAITVAASASTNPLAVSKAGTGSGLVTGSGINCGSTCSADLAVGTVATLTATPDGGSTFAGWSGACTGTGTACTVTMNAAQAVTATFSSIPPGTTVSVNAGGSGSGSFVADAYYSGGSTYSTTSVVDTSQLAAPVPPQAALQTERYGNFTYTIPGFTAGTAATVTLYFVEAYWTSAGQRSFSVAINGATVLSAFDIYAAAGGQYRAIARTFNTAANASGQVVIQFANGSVDNAKVDAITVSSGVATGYLLTVITAGTGSGTVTGSGMSCTTPSTCSASYASGTSVTLTATATGGGTFAGWSGACVGTGTCTVTMTAAQTVTATFNGGANQGPCDIYQAAGTPCVAAHSTVRALYAGYAGSLYQVRRASDGATRDVPVLTAGGFANASVQDSFCANTSCTISIIYDQSSQHNDLRKAPPGATWLPNGGNESSATKGRATVGGHTVYGIYVTGFSDNVAYRNNSTTGVARGNEAEAMYMVVDGRRYSKDCCFDYGNAETNSKDNGNGTMEAIYFGTDIAWGGQGDGNGPWIAADLENGMFKGNAGCYNCYPGPWPSAKSLPYGFVTAMLKGPAANTFTLKGGNAQSGSLTTMWNSSRPSPNYYPKSLEGAIILGTGGDGSNGGTGTFFEGAMTKGTPPDSVDDAIQANIVSAGYGR